ncbi:response regulator transcription factor [Bacillus sp. 1NLA3E]|uniref:response regulator transcription factor n=1 Tax=Bacillus sp. 1NLA3E TaxID=666686 RepID=UPI000247E6C4|nr:response regulator transcription factor [Bacillus sp. 1NLA3E]AGK53260.1 winged helix family two component transcriptional regulator [Bacillus sp. 1NLA3E]
MSKVKILVIEDDPYICELIRLYGEKNGYHLDLAYDGEAGLDKFYQQKPDLVILDVMMPKMDGWEVCKFIRIDYKIPIIMLTARGDIYDRLKGFELGVDDYVTKPFEPEELMARIKAVLKRTNPLLEELKLVEYPFLTINLAEYKVYLHGEEIEMPLKEISLLYYLATRPNQVFTRQQLLDEIWGFAYEGDPRTVDVHVKRIREKLQDEPTWNLKTIRGVGYKFEVQKEV